jgi:hypothetical protein
MVLHGQYAGTVEITLNLESEKLDKWGPGAVAHPYNPATPEAEILMFTVQGQTLQKCETPI